MTQEITELGRQFAASHLTVSRKDTARDLRAHGIEPTSDTVAAWRRGADPIINDRCEAEQRRHLVFVEEFAAEFVAELRAEHPDWTREQLVEAAEPAAWEEHDRQREEERDEAKAHVWKRIHERLYAAGLDCCGVSSKSRSRYYGRWEGAEGRERLRVSDHSIAYACSDCAVCIEVGTGSPDADVIIGETAENEEIDAAMAEAVALFDARCPEEEEEEN